VGESLFDDLIGTIDVWFKKNQISGSKSDQSYSSLLGTISLA